MSQQTPQATPILLTNGGIAPGPHHIHPAYIVFQALRIVVSLLVVTSFAFLGNGGALLLMGSSVGLLPLIFIGFIILVSGVTIAISYIGYKRFLWEITESDIHIYSGIFFKKQVHIPFQRVQSIDFNADLMERVIGIVKLKIETAGGATNKGVMIPALKLAEAEALRAEVFARKRTSGARQEAEMQQRIMAARAAKAGGVAGVGVAGAGAAGAAGVGAAGAAGGVAGVGVAGAGAMAGVPRFDPQTGQPLAGAAQAFPATPRFDPQTGQPLAVDIPRFDPQTGQPLAGTAQVAAQAAQTGQPFAAPAPLGAPLPYGAPTPWQTGSAADSLVTEIGDGIGGLRGYFADQYREDAPIEYEYGLTAKELFLSAISGDHNLAFIAVIAGLISQAAAFLGLFNLNNYTEQALQSVINNVAIPMAIGMIVFFLVIIIISGILGTALQYGGFKARRRGGRIEVERGLISRQYKGVSINRVQSVQINQGFLRRLMGYAELKLLTIDSMGTNQNQQNAQAMQSAGLVIHPFVKIKRVPEILNRIIPEFNGRPAESEYRRLPKRARRRVIVRHVVIFALIYAFFAAIVTLPLAVTMDLATSPMPPELTRWLLAVIWGLLILLIIGKSFGAVLWYRHAAYAYNATTLTLRKGYFGQVTTIIPRQKIQWAQMRQNPLQRFAQVASITAVTAAGVGGTRTKLRDLDAEEASAYLDWVRPHKALTDKALPVNHQ